MTISGMLRILLLPANQLYLCRLLVAASSSRHRLLHAEPTVWLATAWVMTVVAARVPR